MAASIPTAPSGTLMMPAGIRMMPAGIRMMTAGTRKMEAGLRREVCFPSGVCVRRRMVRRVPMVRRRVWRLGRRVAAAVVRRRVRLLMGHRVEQWAVVAARSRNSVGILTFFFFFF